MSDKPSDTPQSSVQQAVALDQEVAGETLAAGQLGGSMMQNRVVSVSWSAEGPTGQGITVLTGTLTVAVALPASFSAFILAGVSFTVSNSAVGGTGIWFSYSGSRSVMAIRDLVVPGAMIALVGN